MTLGLSRRRGNSLRQVDVLYEWICIWNAHMMMVSKSEILGQKKVFGSYYVLKIYR